MSNGIGCAAGVILTVLAASAGAAAAPTRRAEPAPPPTAATPTSSATADPDRGVVFRPEAVETEGSVQVGGRPITYRAIAGTLVVHPKGWDDAAARDEAAGGDLKDKAAEPKAEAAMFYTAYFRKGAPEAGRPITFLFNGGPGSASLWLHMGAFGPRRVVTADAAHTPAAPYRMVDNAYSLLDASDLVFIDPPATAGSRARIRRRPSSASTPTPTPSPSSSKAFCRSTAAGTRRVTCSGRATARHGRRS